MKKLLYLLFAVSIFSACSGSEDEPPKDPVTSFVLKTETANYIDCVSGILLNNNVFKKNYDIGIISKGVNSPNITVEDTVSRLYIFIRRNQTAFRVKDPFLLNKGMQNTLILNIESEMVEVNMNDNTQYPIN